MTKFLQINSSQIFGVFMKQFYSTRTSWVSKLARLSKMLLLIWVAVAFAACSPTNETAEEVTVNDVTLIRNASIIDGSGAKAYPGDVRISDSKIISIGSFEPQSGEKVIDAKGLVLAPGFIDTHSHHDRTIPEEPLAIEAVSQGITTIVGGNDGVSALPISELKKHLSETPVAINIASYTGHGSIRGAIMGKNYKRNANDAEIVAMQKLLTADMEAGSLGLSTGLEYDPGIFSNTDEVVSLAKSLKEYGGRYISHMRSEDRAFHEALEELILIGKEAGIPVQVSHMKLAAIDIWGQSNKVIQRMEKARADGVQISADIYPYTYWESTLTVLLPNRDFHDIKAAKFALEHLAPADGLTLSYYAPNPDLVGMTVAQIAAKRGKSDAETYLELIREAYIGVTGGGLSDDGKKRESVIGVSMSEEDVSNLIAWEHANICSDGAKTGHPRGRGAFPRAIRMYVREKKILTLEEMVRKMTSLSAEHVGISGVGLIKEGYAADLVLFDPDLIKDTATIQKPDSLSEGVVGVWVNGTRVWENNHSTGARPGKFIGRAASGK